ncbi:MAG TPA: hypothetical protein VMD05_05185 [Candidatus Nanoarchaeia archaeon]|nr:hypothetical protein [Candidatus Nanoarchaeia archaeon]
MTILSLMALLGLGILSDVIVTGYYSFVSRGWALLASLSSIPIAILNFYVIGKVVVIDGTWQAMLFYALGNAIGCFLIMTFLKKFKPKK